MQSTQFLQGRGLVPLGTLVLYKEEFLKLACLQNSLQPLQGQGGNTLRKIVLVSAPALFTKRGSLF